MQNGHAPRTWIGGVFLIIIFIYFFTFSLSCGATGLSYGLPRRQTLLTSNDVLPLLSRTRVTLLYLCRSPPASLPAAPGSRARAVEYILSIGPNIPSV